MEQQSRTTMNGKPVFTVPSKTVINFKSGFQKKLLCDGPTFTAGTACAYRCSFCYVPAAMKKQEDFLQAHGVTGKHEDVVIRRADVLATMERQIRSSTRRNEKLVIYGSPLVDVAANMDLVRETVEICKLILSLTNWDIRLLSKSSLLHKVAELLDDEVVKLSRSYDHSARIIYGVSTGTLDNQLAAAFEEDCPSVSKRIQSLHWLQDNGFRTFGMICPSLPCDDQLAFSREMHQALRGDRLEHVWAEVINLRGESFTRTEAALRNNGYIPVADALVRISTDKDAWEEYARATFIGHTMTFKPDQLRFLQYVNNGTRSYWEANQTRGAVIL